MVNNLRDRFPDYEVSLDITAPELSNLSVGFAKVSITPDVSKDTYWIAGFGKNRNATGVHDSLWARAMVLDDGQTRMAIVSIDAIGFGHDEVIRVREQITEEAGIHFTTVTSTHTHEAPDLIGLWGPGMFESGVNPSYIEMVIKNTAKAAVLAAANIRPARLYYAENAEGAIPMLADTRQPLVLDPGIRILHAVDRENDTTLGTLFAWANHPETLWSKNQLLTSDFPHFVREGMEKGVWNGDSLMFPGVGGICVYVNGAIGGLMTTDPRTAVQAPFADTAYLEPSFAKAQAQGDQLAILGLQALDSAELISETGISLKAQSLIIPMDNKLFRLGASLKVLDRGMPQWMKMRSEIAFWQIGPISCLQMPGEIYPEIINGGVEAPEGQDFQAAIIESPPLRELMPG